MEITQALEQSQPGLVGRVKNAIRTQHLNQRAEQNYLHWITRFVLFHDLKDPDTLGCEDRQEFLSYLGDRIEISRARLNQASQALTFFYEDVLGKVGMSETAAA
ncbi:site-specific integrase [Marinobacter arenosus]|uniref:site-specific integrase n=1 Tax=Marinobacter arenosus TaxID=2856822 RepID=UPI001C4C6535|nr:site-specific integrase [Marinobacter arenosus]MBW0147868.1 phage integrase N-terminal SAM-like domain-containing protein [Marinobacter arenosus]